MVKSIMYLHRVFEVAVEQYKRLCGAPKRKR
jgi:hypothetical protein